MRKKWNRLLTALLTGALATMAPQWVQAAPTGPCTQISNIAGVTYKVGGVDMTSGGPVSSTAATFRVGAKVLVDVLNNTTNITVTPGGAVGVLKFTVSNSSNVPLNFALSTNQEGTNNGTVLSDTVDVAPAPAVYVESGDDTTGYDALDIATSISALPGHDGTNPGSKVVYIVYNPTALTAPDASVAVSYLTAAARWAGDNSDVAAGNVTLSDAIVGAASACDAGYAVDVVVQDQDGPGAGDTSTTDAVDSDAGAYVVSTASLTFTKTPTPIWDPINYNSGPKYIPGALVRYEITISNAAGKPSATLDQITDTLVGTLGIDPDLKTQNLNTATPTAESAAGSGFKALITGGSRVGSLSGTPNGGLVNGTAKYYTTTSSADGIDFATPTMTATLSTVLPDDDGGAAGELKGGETLTITFNAVIQ